MRLNLDKSHWKRVAFGDVVRNVSETVRDLEAAGIDRVIAMEHMGPGELKISRWGSTEDGTTFTRRVKPGQTLFGKRRAYQRKVAYAEFDAICSGDIYTFEADEAQLRGDLLPFLVQSDGFFEHALGTSAGSLSPRTNWRDLKDFEFDLPALDEQKRIADLLWSVERHRNKLSSMPAKLTSVYDTWLEHRLAEVPTARLDEVVRLQHGRPVSSALYGKGEFPLLRPGDMNADGTVAWSDTTVRIAQEFVDQHRDWVLAPGDLVINMTAQTLDDRFLGRVCRMHDHALLNQRIGRLQSDDRVSIDYAFVALHTAAFAAWVARRSEGSKIKHMHWRHIADFAIPIPSAAEQDAIVAEATVWKEAGQQTLEELDALVALRASIIAEIFGGD